MFTSSPRGQFTLLAQDVAESNGAMKIVAHSVCGADASGEETEAVS